MDCTLLAAHDLLHGNDYDLTRSVNALVGQASLWSKRTLLETFDETDMTLFRIGLHETGRNLEQIHRHWVRVSFIISNFYDKF